METHKGKILVIDDDTSFLKETEGLLREGGYEVETCSDGHEALSAIKEHTPDCVTLDMRMPTLDGQDLLLLIKRRFPDIAVIICTGVADVDERYLLKSGASDVIQKPFSHSAFFAAIDQAIHQKDEVTPVTLTGYNLREIRDTVLRKIIVKALSRTNFNITHAAKLMGVSRQCLLRYIKRLQIAY